MEIKTVEDLKNYLENIPNDAKIEFGNWCMYDEYTVLQLSNITYRSHKSFGDVLEIELEF